MIWLSRIHTLLRPNAARILSHLRFTSKVNVNTYGFRRGLLFASFGIGSICAIQNPENIEESGYFSATRALQETVFDHLFRVKSLLASLVTTKTEARAQTDDKVIEIVRAEPQTVLQSIYSTAVISALVLSCTVVVPAMFITSILLPFVYGLKAVAYLLLVFASLHAVPVNYSRAFVESTFIQSMWRTASLYFSPFRVMRPAEPLDNSKNYVIALHPHGRLFVGSGLIIGLFHSWFPELWKTQSLFVGINDAMFLTPVFGKFLQLLGAVSVSRASVNRVLDSGNSIMIVPGGIEEVLEGTYDDREVLYLAARKGFCRVALEHSAGLVPCLCLGESSLFQHDSHLRSPPYPRTRPAAAPA